MNLQFEEYFQNLWWYVTNIDNITKYHITCLDYVWIIIVKCTLKYIFEQIKYFKIVKLILHFILRRPLYLKLDFTDNIIEDKNGLTVLGISHLVGIELECEPLTRTIHVTPQNPETLVIDLTGVKTKIMFDVPDQDSS